ncbi:MAG: hypothetical protein HQL52_14940 [Magnetococcales bacterium]|nr:hypothetical protein [Magnetococcales bacterium]
MKLPVQRERVSFMKGLVLFYLIFLVIFFAAAPFFTLLLYWETDLSESILPELVGFCLQGIFLVLIFALYERRSAINAKRSQKIALRTLLSAFVSHCAPSEVSQPSEKQAEGDLPDDTNPVQRCLEAISGDGWSEEVGIELKGLADRNLTALESLTAVAAQIDPEHLSTWIAILDQSRQIRDARESELIRQATQELLEVILKFDELALY